MRTVVCTSSRLLMAVFITVIAEGVFLEVHQERLCLNKAVGTTANSRLLSDESEFPNYEIGRG